MIRIKRETMGEWEQVKCCPICGGSLIISEYFTFSHDYRITKKGKLSKRWSATDPGPMECTTAYCMDCRTYWDGDHVAVEADDTVWLRGDGLSNG